jgi:CRISPR/Cas system-associated endonuclease Cas3-HD
MSLKTSYRPDSTQGSEGSPFGPGNLRREEVCIGGQGVQNAFGVLAKLIFTDDGQAFSQVGNVLPRLLELVEGAVIEQSGNSYSLRLQNTGEGPVHRDNELNLRPREIPSHAYPEGQLRKGLENVIAHCARTGVIVKHIWDSSPTYLKQFVAQTLGESDDEVREILILAAHLHDIGKFLLSSEKSMYLENFYTGKKFDDQNVLAEFLLGHVIEGAKVLIRNQNEINSLTQLICVNVALLHHRIHHKAPYPMLEEIVNNFSGISIDDSLKAQAGTSNFPEFTSKVIECIEQFKSKSWDGLQVTVGELIQSKDANRLALAVAVICIVMNAADIYDARLFDARQYHASRAILDTVLHDMRRIQMPEVICRILDNIYPDVSAKFGSGTSLR